MSLFEQVSNPSGGRDPRGMNLLFKGRPEPDNEQSSKLDKPPRKRTQKDQDEADEEARRKATKDLVQSWMDRLQLISVITTFFASTEAGLLQTTSASTGQLSGPSAVALDIANAGIIGSLIIHLSAAIISFLASFVLVRYKLKEAKKEELKAEGIAGHGMVMSPTSNKPYHDVEKTGSQENHSQRNLTSEPPIHACNPRLEQVGPFSRQPPTNLLSRCHTLCIALGAVGFILALMGIVCYAWAMQPLSVAAFSTAVMGVCLASGGIILMW